jgi:hypothetical protein
MLEMAVAARIETKFALLCDFDKHVLILLKLKIYRFLIFYQNPACEKKRTKIAPNYPQRAAVSATVLHTILEHTGNFQLSTRNQDVQAVFCRSQNEV